MKEYLLPPTMNPDEIEYFEKYIAGLPPKAKLVEWGSGGSTTMFLENMGDGHTLYSIEHNEGWFEKVTEVLKDHPRRSQLVYMFIPPEVQLSFWGYGQPKEENPCFLREYLNPEIAFEGTRIWDADMYLVDGIARGANLAVINRRSLPILGPGASVEEGTLPYHSPDVFIHDYKGREEWYQWAVDMYSEHEQVGSTLLKMRG
jgi:hypothetical protein